MWNLFVLYNKVKRQIFDRLCLSLRFKCMIIYIFNFKETNYHRFSVPKSFSITGKPSFAHFGKHEKKNIWRNLLPIQNEAISLVAMRSNELWLVQKNHGTLTKSNGFSWNENLQRKRSKDGAVVRALVSHQCVPGSIPGPGVICGLGLLLAVFSASRGVSSLLNNCKLQFQF